MLQLSPKPRNYWNNQKVIIKIQELHATEHINDNYIKKNHCDLYNAGRKYFGSWRNAVEAAGFNYDEIKRNAIQKRIDDSRIWNRKLVINKIQELHTSEQINAKYVKENHCDLYSAGIKIFGSWGNAVKEAGIDYEAIKRITRQNAIKKQRFTPEFAPKWTEGMVISEIKELHRKNIPLTDKHISEHYPALYAQGCKRFNGWGGAVNAAGINYDEIRLAKKWNKRRVIEEIRNLYQQNFDLGYNNVVKYHNDLLCAARRRFDTWENALKAANIDYDCYRKKKPNNDYSKEEIIEYILILSNEGKELNATSVPPNIYQQARRKFGSWRNAIEAAGLNYEKIKKHEKFWTQEKIKNEISLLHSQGEPLNDRYMRKHYPSLHDAGRIHFGSWKEAILATGLDYDKIRKEPTQEILLGKAFELTFKYMVDSIKLDYIYSPRFEFPEDTCVPDFVDSNNTWIDTKLSSWTSTIKNTVEKYLKYTKRIKIIYLKGNDRWDNDYVQFIPIDNFYPLLIEKDEAIIEMFEMLKEGKIPDKIKELL